MRFMLVFTFLICASTVCAQRNADPVRFDEKADAKSALQKALARAKKNNRRVLIHWGADTSEWCVALDKSFATDAALRRKRLYEYEWVNIAASNVDLAKKHQIALEDGIPCLTILDFEGKV